MTRAADLAPAPIVFCVAVPATERLDRFLADQLALSRTQAARLIADKRVTAAGRPLRASALLERGAEVSVELPPDAPPRTYSPVTPPQAGAGVRFQSSPTPEARETKVVRYASTSRAGRPSGTGCQTGGKSPRPIRPRIPKPIMATAKTA